jgi:hypothetical protein
VGDVNPGKSVLVDSVELSQQSAIAVILDSSHPTSIGKSSVLTVGKHTSITINLSSPLKDGDVVIIRLVDANGKTVLNADKQPVEVKKNVGHLMTHYTNEF